MRRSLYPNDLIQRHLEDTCDSDLPCAQAPSTLMDVIFDKQRTLVLLLATFAEWYAVVR